MWMPIARKMDRQIVVVHSSISAVQAQIIVRKVVNNFVIPIMDYPASIFSFRNNRLLKNIIIIGCTFPDVEFVGGDLSKARGGGGVKKRYDDQCIIACEKNPQCQ